MSSADAPWLPLVLAGCRSQSSTYRPVFDSAGDGRGQMRSWEGVVGRTVPHEPPKVISP